MPKKWRSGVKLLTERPMGNGDMKKLRSIADVPRETPEKRRMRVLRLRAEVATGAYRPDLSAVARRLVKELHFGSSWN
jgi:hypothetical protein